MRVRLLHRRAHEMESADIQADPKPLRNILHLLFNKTEILIEKDLIYQIIPRKSDYFL